MDEFGAPASPTDLGFPFVAEAADDFMLIDPGDPLGSHDCEIAEVRFWVAFFNTGGGGGLDPKDGWMSPRGRKMRGATRRRTPYGQGNLSDR